MGSPLAASLFLVAVVVTSLFVENVRCDVVIRNYSSSFPAIRDEPATFGPRLPAKGVTGPLKAADPITGCTEWLKNPYTGPWIALMERSVPAEQCSFVLKVRVVRRASSRRSSLFVIFHFHFQMSLC